MANILCYALIYMPQLKLKSNKIGYCEKKNYTIRFGKICIQEYNLENVDLKINKSSC